MFHITQQLMYISAIINLSAPIFIAKSKGEPEHSIKFKMAASLALMKRPAPLKDLLGS